MTQVVLAVVLGLLFAVGTFLVLRRDVVRVVWGVVLFSQGANAYLVTMGGLSGTVPVIEHGGGHGHVTDPLVQALVLTAIVISFGTTAFALVLTYRVFQEHGTIDVADLARGWRERAAANAGAAVAPDGGDGPAAPEGDADREGPFEGDDPDPDGRDDDRAEGGGQPDRDDGSAAGGTPGGGRGG